MDFDSSNVWNYYKGIRSSKTATRERVMSLTLNAVEYFEYTRAGTQTNPCH